MGFILRPTLIGQVRDVATGGEKMPQKSTYFYPKLLSGLVINPHEDERIDVSVGDEIVLMNGWSNGNTIRKPETRWEASELTALMNADIFHSRAPGLRY